MRMFFKGKIEASWKGAMSTDRPLGFNLSQGSAEAISLTAAT